MVLQKVWTSQPTETRQILSALAGPTSIQEMRFLWPRRIHGRDKNSRHLDGFRHLTTLQLQISRKEQTILSANLPGHDSTSRQGHCQNLAPLHNSTMLPAYGKETIHPRLDHGNGLRRKGR